MKESNLDGAIDHGKLALSLAPHFVDRYGFVNDRASFLDFLASVYLESADLENAQALYEELTALTGDFIYLKSRWKK